jgi:hypothetical protein
VITEMVVISADRGYFQKQRQKHFWALFLLWKKVSELLLIHLPNQPSNPNNEVRDHNCNNHNGCSTHNCFFHKSSEANRDKA